MFDMLDDDLDMGYVPTMANNSRSGSMKKLTKKQPKGPAKQPQTKANASKASEFDDLIDDLLEKESKFMIGANDVKPTTANQKGKQDSIDSFFDDPKPKSLQKNKSIDRQEIKPKAAPAKSSSFRMEGSDQIISEDFGYKNSFGKPSNTNNLSLADKKDQGEEVNFVSSRNMKPPIKKRQSTSNLMGTNNKLTITEEESPSLSLPNNQDQIIRPPPRLMNRRPSADKSEQLNLTINNVKSESLSLPNDKKETKKQQPPTKNNYNGLSLTLDEPKLDKRQQKKSQYTFNKDSKQSERPAEKSFKMFQTERSVAPEKPREEWRQQPQKKVLDMNIDQSLTWKETPAPPPQTVAISKGIPTEDFQRQMQQMKNTYQKQVDFLQDNLERQIAVNRETRDKLMSQTSRMIEEERARTKKVHDEQVKRLKQMFEWQKARMNDTLKDQISSLKQQLQIANRSVQQKSFKSSGSSKEDTEYLQMQLKSQKKILQDRQKILQRRQMDLQQREHGLNDRRKKEQQRLRDEQKRILQLQMRHRRQCLQDRKGLEEQKQRVAMELATLQMDVIRKREKAELAIRENAMVKEGVDNERNELRLTNAEVMSRYRGKVEQLEQERERVQLIEQDLVRKLRVVEQRAKEMASTKANRTVCQKKENNWVQERGHQRGVSAQRQAANQRAEAGIYQTKDKFNQLQNNTRERLNISVKQSKGFDLSDYMLNVEHLNRTNHHA